MNEPPPNTKPLLWFAALCAAIGLATALAFPPVVLRGGREYARRANCSSNLRQIGLAFAMYADLYQGRLPMDSSNPTLEGSLLLLTNVTFSGKIFFCPSDYRPGASPTASLIALTTSSISYCYVPNLIWQENPDAIVMVDRIDSFTKGSRWPFNGNHRDSGGNVLFADGHVQFMSTLPADLRDKDGKIRVLNP